MIRQNELPVIEGSYSVLDETVRPGSGHGRVRTRNAKRRSGNAGTAARLQSASNLQHHADRHHEHHHLQLGRRPVTLQSAPSQFDLKGR